MALKNKYRYVIERDTLQGDWFIGTWWWSVRRKLGEDNFYSERIGSGWCHSEKTARKRMQKAIGKYEKHGKPFKEEGEL